MPHSFTNRIILGDCVAVMRTMPAESVHFVLADPPYLVNFRDRRTGAPAYQNDDNDRWLQPAMREIYRVLKWNAYFVCFYGWPRAERFIEAWKRAGFQPVGHIVFAKSYASSQRFLKYQHESAYLLAKGEPRKPDVLLPDVLPWQYTGNELHPTQKPIVSLLPLVLAFSRPKDTVLDPFCGSGSVLLAAKMLGRQYIGIEISGKYCQLAEQRLQQDVPI